MIGCDCAVCRSDDPRNKRTRSSVLVTLGTGKEKKNVLIDTGPDLYQQALAQNVRQVDAVIFTHAHADHIFGMDELRCFNFLNRKPIPLYASEHTGQRIRECFSYIWDSPGYNGGGVPLLKLHTLKRQVTLFGMTFQVVPVLHGKTEVYGFRFNDVAYLTDTSEIPEASKKKLQGLDILVIDALRRREHPTHFSLDEAVAAVKELNPKRAYFTHIAHDLDHETVNAELPRNMQLAHDGLTLRFK